MLEGWDDEARKYKESGTGGLHTKERCQEAKAKLKQTIGPAPTTEYLEKLEAKNDHGNESFTSIPVADERPTTNRFVDHTQGSDWAFTIFTDPTPEGLSLKVNNFRKEHKVRAGQYQIAGSLYTIAIWYE
jgi:hypothetical protein